MSRLLSLAVFVIFATIRQRAFASFCGQSAIPFSFEALPNGQPVLGCARPTCFGWTAEGKPASPPATFYRVNKKPDGYFRKATDNLRPRPVAADSVDYFRAQTAECASSFDSEQCPSEKNFWVGGIGPISNLTASALSVQCCKYDPLGLSTDRGVAVVNPGQIVFGGEILNEKRQYAFDYISDVAKRAKPDGTVSYDVSVRRLTCLPYPPEFSVSVEDTVSEELVQRFTNVKKGKSKVFQAPTVIGNGIIDSNVVGGGGQNRIVAVSERTILEQVGEERVEVIEGPFVAEPDSVVGEVQAEQGFELPPGQVPQGLIEPQPAPAAAPAYSGYAGGAPAYGGYGGYGGGGSGGGGGGGGGFYCFTADTMVRLANGARKRMDELTVGEWIMTEENAKTGYSVVKSWVHRMPEELTRFHRIELEDGKVLKLTAKHFIYKTQCPADYDAEQIVSKIAQKPVYAEDVQIGDCLYVQTQSGGFAARRVGGVAVVEELGIFSPMTENGRIVVNDILASCFNVIHNPSMQDTFFSYVKEARQIPILQWIFGSDSSNTLELPLGMSLLVDLFRHAVPTSTLQY